MTRRDEAKPEVTENSAIVPSQAVDFSIQKQLEDLQDIIYDSFHIPLTSWNVIDEEKLLDQVDLISGFIPEAVQRAIAVLEREEQILQKAEAVGQQIIDTAHQEAQQIRDESRILQQVQQEADQYRYQVQQECDNLQRQIQQECDTLQRQTLNEIEQLKQVSHQEMHQFRQQTVHEAHDIQRDADNYADNVLGRLENNLTDLMRVVSQSRQMLYDNSPQHNPQLNQQPPPGGNYPNVNPNRKNSAPSATVAKPKNDRNRRRPR